MKPSSHVLAVLEVEAVTYTYGGLVALDAVDLQVAAGEIVGIMGPNGAGKTTLLDVVTGISRPRRGHVRLNGRTITAWSPHRRTRAGIRRTFQTVGLAPGLTASENLLATFEAVEGVTAPIGFGPRDAQRRRNAEELLSFFELDDVGDRVASELPLGITKLLEVAKAFADAPSVVLLDEPFAGLAAHEAEERIMKIAARATDDQTAVVIVEHDIPLLVEACNRLVVLDAGKVIAAGTPDEILSNPRVTEAYLGDVVRTA